MLAIAVIVLVAGFHGCVFADGSVHGDPDKTPQWTSMVNEIGRLKQRVQAAEYRAETVENRIPELVQREVTRILEERNAIPKEYETDLRHITKRSANNNHGPVVYRAQLSKHLKPNNVLKMDQALVNVGGGYNKYTGFFTVPRSGYYHFYASLLIQENVSKATADFTADLFVNSKHVARLHTHIPYNGKDKTQENHLSGSEVFYCKTGDHVYWKISGSGYVYGSNYSRIGGYLIPYVYY